MKITVKNEPWCDSDLKYDSQNYSCEATLSTTEDCCAIDVLQMVVKAMLIEGYQINSIAQCMYNLADYIAYNNEFELKLDDEEDTTKLALY